MTRPVTYLRGASLVLRDASKKPYQCLRLQQQQQQRSYASKDLGVVGGSSSVYADQMYESWKSDPKSVHASWAAYFSNLDNNVEPAYVDPSEVSKQGGFAPSVNSDKDINDALSLNSLIRAYQVRGHILASLDPLKIKYPGIQPPNLEEFELSTYNLSEKDLEREFKLSSPSFTGLLNRPGSIKLKELIDEAKGIYCDTIGYEYMHIYDREKCNWLRDRIESEKRADWFSPEEVKHILKTLVSADGFETFLAQKWSAEKRFGLEGLEAMICGMNMIIETSSELGVQNIVVGMPHRGRLNVLANIIKKPLRQIFSEFRSDLAPSEEGSGDVKYHLGASSDYVSRKGKDVHLSLVPNPSHLETVNAVVAGKARAEQFYTGDIERKKVMGVLLHGDAAFIGQGVVVETLNMSQLEGYTTGGTIHIICNNQIGFTTNPDQSRSTNYCTDFAKALQAPIFHVNADDPIAVARVCKLASEWRQEFGTDVFIDIIGYRKFGHNEIDQPLFTQPLMYKKIAEQPSVLTSFSSDLVKTSLVSQPDVDAMRTEYSELCNSQYAASKEISFRPADWLTNRWAGLKSPKLFSKIYETGASKDLLLEIADAISNVPAGFKVNSGINRILKARKKAIQDGQGIDWGTAESLAFGTLLKEGVHVRLSGQDAQRGTFSHRHHVVHDQDNGSTYSFLDNLKGDQSAKYEVTNSPLSEYAVLAFELGYSLVNPQSLVIWEAQFGDFVNGAQIVIDQYISSMEQKWQRQTGLVMLLPHGYEGAGPEHSSARMERFLQAIDDHEDQIPPLDEAVRQQIQKTNMQVLNCSTPANYYHALRRQVHRDFRKPLIIMTPKYLLRLKECTSTLEEMSGLTRFKRAILDENLNKDQVKKVIFCSGKVKYDLLKKRADMGLDEQVAICSVEQLAPFPFDLVKKQVDMYPNTKQVIWCQEEHRNMGAWAYVRPRMETTLGHSVAYVGRDPSASTATGNKVQHVQQQEQYLSEAMQL